ncbi:MAG TPA: VOC family protein [Pyrinomonadaceae bacterium]|jgi:predicted enzyme related to lactoylglutathione lyase|nr:VOC family protein [Pyrinomonadaceae bacterium]
MKRAVGIGGIFIKAKDPEKLRAWYRQHLGFAFDPKGSVVFDCPDDEEQRRKAQTVWSLFPSDTEYFNPSSAPFMINYRVENLAGLLEQLRSEGVEVDERTEEFEYGKFGWIMDPEGNRIELWEPGVPFEKTSSDVDV